MRKHALFILIALIGSIFMIFPTYTGNSPKLVSEIKPTNTETISDGPMNPLSVNVVENSGFENFPDDSYPEDFSAPMSSYAYSNRMYDDPINVAYGSYAGLISSMGNKWMPSIGYMGLTYGIEDARLTYGIEMELYWNMLSNPDSSSGGFCRIRIRTVNDSNYYQDLFYYVNAEFAYLPSNSSANVYYAITDSLQQWNHFKINVTEEYMSYFGLPDSTRKIVSCYFYTDSPSYATGLIEFLIDDFSLSNSTYSSWITNGDFELGNGYNWSGSSSSPAYLSKSTDSPDGSISLNVTAMDLGVGSSYVSVFQSYGYPHDAYYSQDVGDVVIDLKYKYTSTIGTGTNAYGYLRVSVRNSTATYNLYFVMGAYNDIIYSTNSSTNKYYLLAGFYNNDVWHHESFDIYPYVADAKFTNTAITQVQIYSYSSVEGGKSQILIDDLQLITYPAGDPGFEVDWYQDGQTPFAGWYSSSGPPTRTTDAHQGNYACNMTAYNPSSTEFVDLWRNLNFEITRDDYVNFWWRLDEMSSISPSYTYIQLIFNTSYYIDYILGSDGIWSPTNSSNFGYIYVENFNQTGMWTNLIRNVTGDLEALFSSGHSWVLTHIEAHAHAAVGVRTSILLDDLQFSDNGPPTVSIDAPLDLASVEGMVQISVTANDVRTGIDYVSFRIDGVPQTDISIAPFSYEWQTDTVSLGPHEIEVIAYDSAGNSATDTISVTVVDTTGPTINSPGDIEFTEGETGFFILWEPEDLRPDSYQLYVNDVLSSSGSWNSSSENFNISLDGLSPLVYNYTLVVIDEGMNVASDTVLVTVNESATTSTSTSVSTVTSVSTTTTSTTSTTSTTQPTTAPDNTMILILIGVGAVIIVVIVIIVFSKKKQT